MAEMPDGPAASLNDLYLTLRPEPLIHKEELDRFYRGDVNAVRGEDTVARLSRKLQQAFGAVPFKTFVMGHSGVGKSTELSRLLERVKDQHRGIRLSIATELNPASFNIFDVILLMMIRITEETEAIAPNGLQNLVSETLFDDIRVSGRDRDEEASDEEIRRHGMRWQYLSSLFPSVKGEIKYAAERSSETVEHQIRRLPELVALCNRLLDTCSRALEQQDGKEWLLGPGMLEFNRQGWFGVHWIVVDLLKDQEHLTPHDPGGQRRWKPGPLPECGAAAVVVYAAAIGGLRASSGTLPIRDVLQQLAATVPVLELEAPDEGSPVRECPFVAGATRSHTPEASCVRHGF